MEQKIFFIGLLFFIILFSGCKQECSTDTYTKLGDCCTYVCDKDCPYGYVSGTCNCECLSEESSKDMNIDEIFDDDTDVEPPQIPT